MTFKLLLIVASGSWVNVRDGSGSVLIYPWFTVPHKGHRFVDS